MVVLNTISYKGRKATQEQINEIRTMCENGENINHIRSVIKKMGVSCKEIVIGWGFGAEQAVERRKYLSKKAYRKAKRYYCNILKVTKTGYNANLMRTIEWVF